jgi:hypothetical protein
MELNCAGPLAAPDSANTYSAVIDVQHWRHYFLIMGVLWGLVIAAAATFFRPNRIKGTTG